MQVVDHMYFTYSNTFFDWMMIRVLLMQSSYLGVTEIEGVACERVKRVRHKNPAVVDVTACYRHFLGIGKTLPELSVLCGLWCLTRPR